MLVEKVGISGENTYNWGSWRD